MRPLARIVGVATILAVGIAGRALAQHPQTREGFWIGFGFGHGSADLKSPTLDSLGATGREGGATGFVKLGGTLSKSVLLGGEVNAWVKSEGGVTFTVGNVSAAAYFYPAPQTGFFVKGGCRLWEHPVQQLPPGDGERLRVPRGRRLRRPGRCE